MQDIAAEARGRWPSILAALGVAESYLNGKHGPCLFCGGKDRWRFTDKDGKGLWICNACGAGDGLDLLMKLKGYGFKEAVKDVQSVLPGSVVIERKKKDEKQTRNGMNRTWLAAKPIVRGDAVETYLAGRGIVLKDYPSDLRCGRDVPYYDEDGKITGRHDAMIAMVRDHDGKPATLHITYLEGGTKAAVPCAKKTKSTRPAGSAVRLARNAGMLVVAEGIETALKYMMETGVPAWSCIAADGLASFMPPPDTAVIVAGDNDENYAGQAAAYALAKKLASKKIDVKVCIAKKRGTDWADAENW